MDDNNITLCVILCKFVNVNNFINWFTINLAPSFERYLEDWKMYELSGRLLNDFEYKFLINSLAWKGLIQL